MTFDLQAWLAPRRRLLEDRLGHAFPDAWPAPFGDMLRYPLLTGGKRVRPMLCLAAAEAVTGGRDGGEAALIVAGAIELVHTYSLVHDDLPAMDDDDVRRGRPTVHKVYGEAAAILVGDALLTEAFAWLAAAELPAATRVRLVRRLADAAGWRGMVGGQAADVGLGGPIGDLPTLERLHAGKTGALLAASVVAGGLVAEADAATLDRLEAYGRSVGLAFQLADDVLDADQDAGADGPPSYVRLLGVDETRRRAAAMVDAAIAAVEGLPHPDALVAIARYVVARDH